MVSWLKINGIYIIDTEYVSPDSAINLVAHFDKLELWHKRLGHFNEKFKKISYQGAFENGNVQKLTFYEHCLIGKQVRLQFIVGIHKSQNMLYIYSTWL